FVGSWWTRSTRQFLDKGWLYAVHPDWPVFFSLTERQHAILSPTDTHRVSQHRVEHGLKLAGRARDYAEHLRRRSLLLQRLGQVACARLHLVEQAHVLDRDHRLVGECFCQLDLFLRKGPHLGAAKKESADDLLLSQ